VETMIGNASLASNSSSSCSFCTAPVSPPTILAVALVQANKEEKEKDISLLLVNLKNSTFPTSATSTCHILVTSSATPPIQMPCQEVLLVSLPSGSYLPNQPSSVSVKAALGSSEGPWSEEKSIKRRPLPPKLVGARMQNDTVLVTFDRATASLSKSTCQVNISKTGSSGEEDGLHLPSVSPHFHLPSVSPHCDGQHCTAFASAPLASCSTYNFYMRCSTVVKLDPSTIQSLRSLLNPDHFNNADQHVC